ncbi:MAG: hypothetical protein H6Q76_1859 [Firmicutes bacterium]|nr:hypothetical protein [Bacillota bacterium]
MARTKGFKGLLILTLFMVMIFTPMPVMADGMPAGSDDKQTNTPGTSSRPNSAWPPSGSVPKGNLPAGAFAGTWYAFVDNTAFTIVIEQEGRIIKGAHTAVYDYGRRVDSSVGGVSMVGTLEGNVAYMEWKSGLSPENGKATLEYLAGRPATLHWKIVDELPKPDDTNAGGPVEVSYFLPRTAYLIRK